jgi:hypothetical protein
MYVKDYFVPYRGADFNGIIGLIHKIHTKKYSSSFRLFYDKQDIPMLKKHSNVAEIIEHFKYIEGMSLECE